MSRWVFGAVLGCASLVGCADGGGPVDDGFPVESTTGRPTFGGSPDAGVAVPLDGAAQGQGGSPTTSTGGGGIDAGHTTSSVPGSDAGADSSVVTTGDGGVAADAGSAREDASADAGRAEPGPVVNAAGMPTSCADPVLELQDPDIEVTSTPTLYDIDADTLPGIRRQMTQRSPAPMAGAVEWRVWWDFDWTACDGSGLAVGVDVTYIMPRWTQPDPVAPEVVEGWSGYIDALWCHEYGHTQFGLNVAEDSYRALAELAGNVRGCAALRREADRLFQPILQRYAQEEAAYDRDTDHGATMGARLPTDTN